MTMEEEVVRQRICNEFHAMVDRICSMTKAELSHRRWDIIVEIEKEDKLLSENVECDDGYDRLLLRKAELSLINAVKWHLFNLQFIHCPSCDKLCGIEQRICPRCGADLKEGRRHDD